MSIVVINPNSTTSMTNAMVKAARKAAPHLTFDGWTSHDGPPSIQGAADGAAAAPPLLRLIEQADRDGAGGIIIGCFDDTALAQASALANCPVIGIGQAAYHHAALRQWRFSVVTTLGVSVPVIESNIRDAGLDHCASRVRASDVPVLTLENDPANAQAQIVAEAERAQVEDNIQALILGCAGMVQVTTAVRDALRIRVIDPVETAARCMAWMVA